MKKPTIFLINILILITLSACSTSSITDNGTIDATTNITWDNDKESIVVSTVTIKCNDNYYGAVVNDSINFNNNNNYFTTGSGLLVQITDNDKELVSNNSSYSYKATIEDNVSLYVSGNDEDKIKEVFNNVFKTSKESYQMFSHDINQGWTNNVVITSDVVSFSNGTDTAYIYQNEGSLSEGCLDGKIEPTVFKKQLRGIDIPITYPENIEGVSNYIPYGTQDYEHWTNEGYTPYSAYDLFIYDDIDAETLNTNEVQELVNERTLKSANYIILANNDSNVLNLFEEKNDHNQNLYSLSSVTAKINSTLEANIESLSSIKDVAISVINSDNRYHFGVLKTYGYLNQWTESNKDGYYVDGNSYYVDRRISGQMSGKLVIPTIKYSTPTYNSTFRKSLDENGYVINNSAKESGYFDEYQIIDYAYAGSVSQKDYITIANSSESSFMFDNHGASGNSLTLIEDDITGLQGDHYTNDNIDFENHYFILEGDYLYYYNASDDNLYIFENVATYIVLDKFQGGTFFDAVVGFDQNKEFSTYVPKLILSDLNGISIQNRFGYLAKTISCFMSGSNNLSQEYFLSSIINY